MSACTQAQDCYDSSEIFPWKIPISLIHCSNEIVFQMQIESWVLQKKWSFSIWWPWINILCVCCTEFHYHTNYNYFIIALLEQIFAILPATSNLKIRRSNRFPGLVEEVNEQNVKEEECNCSPNLVEIQALHLRCGLSAASTLWSLSLSLQDRFDEVGGSKASAPSLCCQNFPSLQYRNTPSPLCSSFLFSRSRERGASV